MFRRTNQIATLASVMLCAASLSNSTAVAQDAYPTEPVRIIIGFSAGSSTDVATRLIAEGMQGALGQRVVVENRPGAASNVATQAVANAQNDGYTLLMGTVANTINTALDRDVDFSFPGDFEPIGLVGAVPMILSLHPDVGAGNLEELVSLLVDDGEELLYGSAGVGTAPHLSAELFASSIGASLVHVPYAGSGDAVADLVAHRIDMMFAPQSSAIAQIEQGSLRAVATSLSDRSSALPDIPTISEGAIEGFDTSVWFGLMAPSETPPEVIEVLSDAINEALESQELQDRFVNAGIQSTGGTSEEMRTYIQREIENWSQVVEDADVSVD